jgi:hypothetical protein
MIFDDISIYLSRENALGANGILLNIFADKNDGRQSPNLPKQSNA